MILTALADATAYTNFNDLGLIREFHIGPLPIRFYSLAYIVGIFSGYWLVKKMLKQPGAPMAERHVDDLLFYAMLGVILGGRLGYVLFYNLDAYLADPAAILRLWDGGMSFHGGVLGVTLAIWWVANPERILADLDIAVPRVETPRADIFDEHRQIDRHRAARPCLGIDEGHHPVSQPGPFRALAQVQLMQLESPLPRRFPIGHRQRVRPCFDETDQRAIGTARNPQRVGRVGDLRGVPLWPHRGGKELLKIVWRIGDMAEGFAKARLRARRQRRRIGQGRHLQHEFRYSTHPPNPSGTGQL